MERGWRELDERMRILSRVPEMSRRSDEHKDWKNVS